MTQAEFDAAATSAHDGHWLTGEDPFLHVSAVMQVEGWDFYGHFGHNRLTEPQRVLMMWSDLVGQTANGGFTQFVDNYEGALELAYPYIAKLGWSELLERFEAAFREQAGDPARPQLKRATWMGRETAEDARARMLDALARKASRWRPWTRARERTSYEPFSDVLLNTWYDQGVASGEFAPHPEPQLVGEGAPTMAADAFDDWFHLDTTKAASRVFVGDYIRRHRDQLCRLSG